MTAKEYLSQVKRLDDIISCRLRELEYWRHLSRSVSGGGFGEHHNPNRPTEAPFARCLDKIDGIERDVGARIGELVDLRKAGNRAIDGMEDSEERLLLRCRYLDSLSWEDISRIMSVSLRTAHRIHGAALQNFPVPNGNSPMD